MQWTITSNSPRPPTSRWNEILSLSSYYNFITVYVGTSEARLNVREVNSFLIFREELWRHRINFHLRSRRCFQWQVASKWKSVVMKVREETSSMLDNIKARKVFFLCFISLLYSLQLQSQCCWANHRKVHHLAVRGFSRCVLLNIHLPTFQMNFMESNPLTLWRLTTTIVVVPQC